MSNKNKLKLLAMLFVFTTATFWNNTIGAAEYLLFDDFEYELTNNAAPVAYTADFSKNRLLSIDGIDYISYVKEAEEKGSRAFFVETKSTTTSTMKESCIDYRYLPTVTSGDVTCEFSVRAPVSKGNKAAARFTLPVNGAIPVLALLDHEKNLKINDKLYTKWESGVWYNIAVTVHLDRDVCDIYLNGVLLDKGVTLASAPNGIDSVGGRVKAASILMATGNTPCDNLVAYDDIRIYKGDYKGGTYDINKTDVSVPFNAEKEVYVEKDVSAKELKAGFGNQASVYKDNSFIQMAENEKVNNGAYLSVAYPDGVASFRVKTATAFDGFAETGFSTATAKEMDDKFKGLPHPRIVLTEEKISRIKVLKETDGVMKKLCARILKNGTTYLDSEPVAYGTSGDDALSAARSVRDRVFGLGMSYLLTEDERYAKRLWQELYTAGSFSDWGHSQKFLATGEMTAAFGIAYDWLYDYWTSEQKEFIENAIVKLGLKQSLDAYTGRISGIISSSNWPYNEGNWNAVCNGGTLIGAAAIYEAAPDICSVVSSDALRGLGYMMKSFATDGAWEEGVGYWSYMMRYLTIALDTLYDNFGGDFNLREAEGLDNTIEFVRAVTGSVGINNFHDVDYNDDPFVCGYLYWMADKTGSREYFDERSSQILELGEASIYDIIFYNPDREYKNINNIPGKDAYFGTTELVSMRSGYERDDLYLSYHAGKTNVSHSHADDGAFVLDMLGERWALDLGPDSYSLIAYHGGRRFNYYRTRAEGHNTLVINPDRSSGQVTGSVTYAQPPVIRGRNVYSTADLSEAYSDNASSVKRGFLLTDDRSNVVIRDEIALKNKSNVYWFMHTDAQVTLKDSKTAVLNKNGKSVYVRLLSNAGSAVFSVMDAKPFSTSPQDSGQNPNEGIRKLAITANESGTIYFQVSFSSEEDFVYPDTAIDEWDEIDGGTQLDEAFDDGKFSGLVKKGSAALLDAGYAKKGKALILGKDSEVYYSLPKGDNQTVTMSVSMRAEKESSVISGNNTLLKILSDGCLEFLGERVMLLADKRWYNFAIEATKADTTLYINGEKVKTTTATELSDLVLKSVSGGGFDDLSVYSGSCKEVNCELEFLYSYYVENDTIFIVKEIKTSEFLNRIAGRADVDVYSDLSGGIRADIVGEDTTVALRSDDGRIVKYYNVSTNVLEEELLTTDIEKAKSLGKNKALAKGMFTGGISSTEIKNFNGTTAFTRVSESGSGKNGVSYYFEKVNSPNTDEMTFDFKFIPNKESGTVTFEMSIKAPEGTTDGNDTVRVYIPYNGTYKRMIVFDDMGQITLNNSVVEKYKPGRWYNFAISFHIGTKYADFYLDGEWLGKNQLWSYQNSDKIDNVGGRFRISNQITGLAEGKKYSGTAAFDDISVYAGEYYPEKYTPRLVRRDGKNGMRLNSSCSLKTLRSQLAESFGAIKLYSDESFNTPDAEYVSDGQLLTIASDRIVKYFDVEVLSGLSYDKGRVTATIPEEASLYLVNFGDDNAVDNVKKYEVDGMYTAAANGFDKALLWHKDTMTPVCEELIIP